MRLASLLFIVAWLAAEPPKLSEPYRSLVDLSHSAPPEFAADTLLRVVESGKIADRDARRELVEQAFQFGAMAKFPVRMRAMHGNMADTRSGFLSKAYDLKLDALSLQSRAVRAMVTIDPAKARELFLQIPRPALAPLTCQDALVYDTADYYQALTAVVHTGFSAQARKKEEHLTFLLDYLGQASSPSQLAPLARVVKSVDVTPQQREIVLTKFNGLLESMQSDDRSFSASLDEIGREITPEMQASFEKYKLKSKGCPDDSRQGVTIEMSKGPVHAGSTPHLDRYWESAQAKAMLEAGLKLRFTRDGKIISESARSSREWQQQLVDYLSQLADWKSDQEKSEADYYHQKCIVYEALVELIPPSPQRDKTIQAYVDFIVNSNLQQQSPVEWFMHAHSMLERVRNTNSGEPNKMLDAFESAGNPVLMLYAAEEKIFGAQIPSWVQ